MKTPRQLFLLLVILFTAGCKKDKSTVDSSELTGRWQLIGQNFGLPDGHVNIENGYELTFRQDGTFFHGRYTTCPQGRYTRTDSTITFDYHCDDKSQLLSGGIQEERFRLANNALYLTPTYLSCAEGCVYVFKKIAD